MRLLLVALVVLAVFVPVTAADFLYWDDDALLLRTVGWRTADWLAWAFTARTLGHWMPLTWLSYSLDYALWGLNPAGYHLTSLLLHAVNAALVALIVQRLGMGPWAISAVALAWALHPLRVESVAWLTERRDVLMAAFYLGSVLAWLVARRRLSLLLFAGALLSKSLAVSLPCVLLVLDWYRDPDWSGRVGQRVRPLLPFFAASVATSAVALSVIPAGIMHNLETTGIVERLGIALYGLGFYLTRWVVPMNLSPLYELPRDLAPLLPHIVLAALLVGGISMIAWHQRHRRPAILAAWAASLVILLPVSGLVQNGPQIVADRYTYLASIPWTLLAGGWLAEVRG